MILLLFGGSARVIAVIIRKCQMLWFLTDVHCLISNAYAASRQRMFNFHKQIRRRNWELHLNFLRFPHIKTMFNSMQISSPENLRHRIFSDSVSLFDQHTPAIYRPKRQSLLTTTRFLTFNQLKEILPRRSSCLIVIVLSICQEYNTLYSRRSWSWNSSYSYNGFSTQLQKKKSYFIYACI